MITKQNESRNNCFECSRAICMIWIVCILHCSEYIRDCPWRFDDPLFIDITYGVVATFVFLSGYFIGKKSFAERQSIKRFYIRRLKGLYIPFFISCTIMLAMHYIWGTVYILSVKQYFLSLVGLSMLIPPAPSTLWFVVFMLQCYLVAPFVVGYKNRVFACIIWYSCVILIHSMVKPIWGIEPDSRILLLLPVFLLGLCLPERIPEVISLVSIFMLIGIIAILESIGVHYDSSCRYALIGCLVALFIELGILLARNPLLANRLSELRPD